MTAGCFLDTNVLLYAVSTTPSEGLRPLEWCKSRGL